MKETTKNVTVNTATQLMLLETNTEEQLSHYKHNMHFVLNPDNLSLENLPNVDTLVTIGTPNLIVLRRHQRQKIENLNKRIVKLQKILEDIDNASLDNRNCNYRAIATDSYLGEACTACPVFEQYYHYLTKKALTKVAKIAARRQEGLDEILDAVDDEGFKVPCPLFCSTKSEEASSERTALIAKAKDHIDDLRHEKKLHIKYIDNITKAIHDERTLPNLPIFADWRPADYCKDNQIVCVFLTKDTLQDNATTDIFLCRVTGDAMKDNERIYNLSDIPLKTGEIYSNPNCSVEKLLNGGITIDDIGSDIQLIPSFDQRTPHLVTIDDLLEFKRHPEYARTWAYTNHHAWSARPSEVEPMLEAIKQLNI